MNKITIYFITIPEEPRISEISDVLEPYNPIIIDFYSSDLELLNFIAKHRILPTPTILVFNGTKVIGRITHIPKKTILKKLINELLIHHGMG